MSEQIPSTVRVKIEPNTNTLIQSYINTFNKEITKSEAPINHMEESSDSIHKIENGEDTLEITAVTENIQITGTHLDVEIFSFSIKFALLKKDIW